MRLLRAFALLFTAVLFFQCQKELSYVGSADPKPAIPAPIAATVQGNITDENGQPAAGVNIRVGNKSAVTDVKGYFRIKDADLDKYTSLVVAEKNGYFKGLRSFSATSGVNHIEIQLLKKDLAGTVDAVAGGEAQTSNGFKINLPANGIVMANGGGAYTGTVNVFASFIDPTQPAITRTVPGSFLADDKNGGRVTLASYGMMAVELETPSGDKLQIKPGSKAKLTSPIPSSLQSSAPSSIALWYVDESKGIWKEEGSAQKSGNQYTGEVSHFSFWNCDVGIPSVNLSMTLKNNAGQPVVHALVKLRVTTPFPSLSFGFTDSLGQVSGLVPMNQPISMEVSGNCDNVVFNQAIGPFSQDTDMGDVVLPTGTPSLVTITGTLLNCNSSPVGTGFVMLNFGNVVRYDAVDANGVFNISLVACSSTSNSFELIGIDGSGMQQSAVYNGTVTGATTNVGNINACGSTVDQFISFTLDGTSYSFTPPLDSMVGRTITDTSGTGWHTVVGAFRKNGPVTTHSVYVNFPHDLQVAGTYNADIAIGYPPQQMTSSQGLLPITTIITQFPAAIGDYYEGNFSGSYTENGSLRTITNGIFRLKRKQ